MKSCKDHTSEQSCDDFQITQSRIFFDIPSCRTQYYFHFKQWCFLMRSALKVGSKDIFVNCVKSLCLWWKLSQVSILLWHSDSANHDFFQSHLQDCVHQLTRLCGSFQSLLCFSGMIWVIKVLLSLRVVNSSCKLINIHYPIMIF